MPAGVRAVVRSGQMMQQRMPADRAMRAVGVPDPRADVPVATVSAARLDQIGAELTRTLFRNCPIGVVGATIVAVMLAATLHGPSADAAARAYLWSVMVGGCAVAHLLLCRQYRQCAPGDAQWRRWNWAFTLIVIAEGVTWCFGAIQFLADGNAFRALVSLLAWAGVISAAIVVFGPFLRTYLAFIAPAMIPHIVFLLDHPYPFSGTVLALILIYTALLPVIVFALQRQMIEAHRLRFENFELAEDMRQQKERADQANRAKSSFLAAASHDLRQPVHALGLFIGALRGRAMDAGSRALVDKISGSVEAMDGLFAALLDISKLDAGVVEAQFAAVAVGPLLERLGRDHAVEAAAKGLRMRVVPTSAVVHSDPALLERVVRNIVANAVRYTARGGVVIGCRRCGDAVGIEVWDSGCGIAAPEQVNIFKEFYQVDNPERDRNKGLGLGLAIVQRTARLLGATLTLQSEPGRGSGFRLRVPRAAAAAAPAPPAETAVAAMRTGLIFVVDDEVAIQQATASLLASWGHRVVAGSSPRDLIAQQPACPDLIICDYRLRDGETGIAAIRELQAAFGADIPAIVITGDTAPDRILEAQAGGHLLLHKPLSNRKLRAAIGNVLRRADTARAA